MNAVKEERKDNHNTAWMTMTYNECNKLQIGDHVDVRDGVGRFLLATILQKEGSKIKVHFQGWDDKHDEWADFENEPHRFAAARSISRMPNTKLPDIKIRDYVDINPTQRHRGWRVGQIRRMDEYSGQAQIVYKDDGQEFLYWTHLNNPEEIAQFMTRAAETIALQQKIAEFEKEEKEKANADTASDESQYKAIDDYYASATDELDLTEGEIYTVIQVSF